MVSGLSAGHRWSCMVRNLEIVKVVDVYVVDAGLSMPRFTWSLVNRGVYPCSLGVLMTTRVDLSLTDCRAFA